MATTKLSTSKWSAPLFSCFIEFAICEQVSLFASPAHSMPVTRNVWTIPLLTLWVRKIGPPSMLYQSKHQTVRRVCLFGAHVCNSLHTFAIFLSFRPLWFDSLFDRVGLLSANRNIGVNNAWNLTTSIQFQAITSYCPPLSIIVHKVYSASNAMLSMQASNRLYRNNYAWQMGKMCILL